MGVPLQYTILGFLLALATYSIAEPQNLRQIREAPPPSPVPSQNVTEINNRDLNKIVKVNPKTEVLDSKPKPVNNYEELPLKLGKADEHTSTTSKDEIRKQKTREENSKAIWPTFSPTQSTKPHSSTSPSSSEILFGITRRHPSFDNSADLTTPKTELFDQKYKETVESVKQKLDDAEADREETNSHEDDEDDDDEDDEELSVEHLLRKKPSSGNTTLEFLKTKSLVVNNETIDKNSIHKDVNFEQAKKINFENAYNETEVYDDHDDADGGDTSSTTVKPIGATFVKESVGKASSTFQLLSNNIETEANGRIKSGGTTTTPSAKLDHEDVDLLMATKPTTSTTISSTIAITTTTGTTPVSVIRANVSDEENVIPSQKGFEKSTETATTIDNPSPHSTNETSSSEAAEGESTEATTTDQHPTTIPGDITGSPAESTTLDAIISTSTTSVDDSTLSTTVLEAESNTEITDAITTTTSLPTTLIPDEPYSTTDTATEGSEIRNDISSSTIDDKANFIPDLQSTITPTNVFPNTASSGSINVEVTTAEEGTTTNSASSTTEKHGQANSTTPPPTTTEHNGRYLPTTTKSPVVKMESTTVVPTTGLPSNVNEENVIRKIVFDDKANESTSSPSSSSTSTSSTITTTVVEDSTTEDGTTETSSTVDSITRDEEDGGSNKGKIAAIAISCVGAVCLVVLAGLLYVMRKRQRRLNYGPRCRPVSLDDYSIDNLSVYNSVRGKAAARMSKRSFGNPAFDDPVAPSHPLNFPALAKFSTNFEDIRAEFEDIPQITARTSELPEGCDTKNRYANVIPLPETRVYLKPIDGYPNSDYINANYVTGPGNIKGYYIATQGPMQNTVDDFWRMIWEQHVKLILMLTHLVENGLEKCVDYLPESEIRECSRLFGDFQITLKKREVKEKYIISSLQLKNMVSNSWREVTHFWYLGWPERGVPNEANSLIAFLIEARSYMKTVTMDKKASLVNGGPPHEHNPVVVHCSPGTGRTGVAIACDIAIREFETTRLVDVPKIVYRIRRDRANAVQTKEQYMFIYKRRIGNRSQPTRNFFIFADKEGVPVVAKAIIFDYLKNKAWPIFSLIESPLYSCEVLMVVSLYATKLTGGALENNV